MKGTIAFFKPKAYSDGLWNGLLEQVLQGQEEEIVYC
jgi:hypothetical protein